MTEFDPDRRKVLVAGGAALTVALAGCTGGDDDGGDDGGDDGNGDMTPEEQVDSYLNDNSANGYSGTGDIVDETGSGSLTIDVGPDGDFRFDPAAVRIDSGTTITWEWLSDGHSVEQTDSDLSFEDADIQNEGATHEHTFDSSGAFLYQCGPHSANGHHGAIIIE